MIRPASTMPSFIRCAGSARASGSFTAPWFAWARLSMTKLCCHGFRASACRDPLQASRSCPASSGVTDWDRGISKRSCRTNPAPYTAMIWATSALRSGDDLRGIFWTISAACRSPSGRKSSNGCARSSSRAQASYAIQDTPDVVQQHYGRFLPQDKAALAAKILNQVWEAA